MSQVSYISKLQKFGFIYIQGIMILYAYVFNPGSVIYFFSFTIFFISRNFQYCLSSLQKSKHSKWNGLKLSLNVEHAIFALLKSLHTRLYVGCIKLISWYMVCVGFYFLNIISVNESSRDVSFSIIEMPSSIGIFLE